ncbi:MotE family protein [Tabrizicola sp. M-4]|uniref:MotE family protein n=1 Tax=Tabrizicola sp. M-4 TaxID=3055847 RepID=UPI003DA85BAA
MKRFPRSSLTIIALFLAASGAIRIGFGVGEAMASLPEGGAPETAPATCPAPPLALAQALSERESLLSRRETALEDRIAALDLAEAAITARLQELQTAEAELQRVVDVSDGAAEGDLTRLTAMYEAMKPTDSARLLSSMPVEFAAGFLGRMRPEAAALILAGMEAEPAFAITALLAGRNALAPTE